MEQITLRLIILLKIIKAPFKMKPFILAILLLFTFTQAAANSHRLHIGNFSSNDLEGWEEKSFSGNTKYNLLKEQDKTVLLAESNNAASALYRKTKIDLTKTPYLNWSWKKLSTLNPGDESKKQGDDFVARVYVVKNGGLFLWKTKALSYVWSFSHKKNEYWNNPYTGDKAKMIAVRDKHDAEDGWFSEKRNLLNDFKQYFNIDITEIDGIAIMTDTDNSNGKASTLYGDIYFTAE